MTSTSSTFTKITNTIITTTNSSATATSPSTRSGTTRYMYGSFCGGQQYRHHQQHQHEQQQQHRFKKLDKSIMLISNVPPTTVTVTSNSYKYFSSALLPSSSPFFNSCQMTAMALAPTLSVISSVSSSI